MSNQQESNLLERMNEMEEKWTTLNWNGLMVNRYLISSKGRMYDKRDEKFISYSVDKDGYFMASIHIDGLGYKKIRVHRFELMSFQFTDNFKNLQVNHKNGNKQDLELSNLEWITPIGNTRHGWDTGLNNNIGTNNGTGKYDDATIRRLCELIDEGKSNAEICTLFGISEVPERKVFSALISGIKSGKTHRNISTDYRFMQGGNVQNRYSLEFAELVCQFLSDETRTFSYK